MIPIEEEDFDENEEISEEGELLEEVVLSKDDISEIKNIDFDFTSDQKVYWEEEQERAVNEYLWLDESWLKNKIKWEHETAILEERPVDSLIISIFKEKIEESKLAISSVRKEKIFKEKLEKSLTKLIENIVFTYKLYRQDIDVKTLQYDCLSFLITKFANFDPSQKNKAFSYYGTVAKHYLIGSKKDLYKTQQSNLDFESKFEEVNTLESIKYNLHDLDHLEESSRLFSYVIYSIREELQNNTLLTENDRGVGNAIVNIFENHEKIQIYSKNNLYQMIKEYTNLQTKEITSSLSKFKMFYKTEKKDFLKRRDNI